MSHVAVLCLRDEGAFLLDWLAHHLVVGIDHVVVCSNDCSDGTDAMLDRLEEMGHVTHIRNDGPYDKGGIQFTGLKRAAKTQAVRKAEWLLPLDIDEFINVKTGGHKLEDLHAALPDATAITLTWRLFGNAGIEAYQDAPVTTQFTRAAPEVIYWPWRAAMFKTLYRNDGTYGALGVHRPRRHDDVKIADAKWYDGEGRLLPEVFHTKRIFSNFGQSNTKLAQLNHYALGAMESFVLKSERGRAVHEADKLGLDYWVERNHCAIEDKSILVLSGEVAEKRAELASDRILSDLHSKSVAWRKSKFHELMLQEPSRALYGRLLTTPISEAISKEKAKTLMKYAQTAHFSP